MKKTALPIILAFLATASTVSAEGLNYLSYGASYTNLSVSDVTVDAFGGGVSADFQSGNFVFNGGANTNRLSSEGESISLTGVDARIGYLATTDLSIYAGLVYFDATDVDAFTTYNVGAEYGMNALTIGVNYDDSEEDGYVATTTVYGSYRVGEAVETILAVSDTDGLKSTTLGVDFDNDQFDVAAMFNETDGINILALDAAYALGNGFRLSGNYIDLDGEIDMLSVGAGYEVSQNLWVDLNLGRIEATGSESIDLIGLALTYEMGGETMLVDRATTTQLDAMGPLAQTFLTSF